VICKEKILNYKKLGENEKRHKKTKDSHANGTKDLKLKLMQSSETLRSMVLERENLRENDRIMMNTLDMMKKYVDQVKSMMIMQEMFNCEKCTMSAQSNE
jgi:hypothetical protein